MTEVGVIPEDWEVHSLSSLVKKTIRYGVVQPGKYFPNGCPMLRSQDYSKGWKGTINMHRVSQSIEAQFQETKLKKGEIIVTIVGAGIGQIVEVPEWLEGAVLSRSTGRISVNENLAYSKYITFFLQSSLGKDQILLGIKEGAQPVVSGTDVGNCKIPLPPTLQEQKRIATALSEVDALIGQVDKLIAKKQAIKQGAMQQLLTGQTRLPGFGQGKGYKMTEVGTIPEDWEVTSFRESFSFVSTASFSRAEMAKEGDVACVHYGDLHTRFGFFLDLGKEDLPMVKYEKAKRYTQLQDGDLILADASEDLEGIGKMVEIKNVKKPGIAGLHTILLRDKSQNFVDGFRAFIQDIKPVKASMERLSTGLKVYGISKRTLEDILIPIPPKKEQKAIANFLIEVEGQLESLNFKKSKLQSLKQGMMQELLTGKTRLI